MASSRRALAGDRPCSNERRGSAASYLGCSAIMVAALGVGATRGAGAQAPAAPASKPMVLEATWELAVSGYGSQARIVLQGTYEVHPWKALSGGGDWRGSLPTDVCGGAAEASCFALTYRGGRLVSSRGTNSVGDAAIFAEAREEPEAGPDGVIRPTPDGSIEILLRRRPSFTMGNAAAEEALGCWSQDWPTATIGSSELRTLHTLRRRWDIPAMGAEERGAAPGCEPGTASLEVRTVGSACEPLESACERSKRWPECALSQLSDLMSAIAQARLHVVAEHAAQQPPALPEASGYPLLLIEIDRLQQQGMPRLQAQLLSAVSEFATDCGLLPGPEEDRTCREAAQRVEGRLEKARARLEGDLSTQVTLFERASLPAITFTARGQLLARLRAAESQLDLCR